MQHQHAPTTPHKHGARASRGSTSLTNVNNMKATTFTCPERRRQQHHRRGGLMLQAAIVMTSINIANASLFPGPPSSSSSSSRMMDVPVIGQDHTMSNIDGVLFSKNRTSKQGRKRWITSIRGGSSSNKGTIDAAPAALNEYSDKIQGNKGGFIQSSPILSIAVLIINESINVACAATVISGYFGAWIASWMVTKAHKLLPILSNNGIVSGESDNLLLGKYRLTTLASIGFLILHTTGIQSNSKCSRLSDASFVAILWTYSHIVNPTLGGVIGCTHILLSVLSTILGNRKLINALDHLGDLRFKKLPQGEEDIYIASKLDRIPKVPVVTFEPKRKFKAAIASMMGSASVLIVFPQYFLGLYMLGCTLVSWSSTKQFEGRWKRFEKFVQWLSEEICVSYDKNGRLDCGIDSAVAGDSMNECLDPWKVSKRLVALYWIIALTKTAIAFVIM